MVAGRDDHRYVWSQIPAVLEPHAKGNTMANHAGGHMLNRVLRTLEGESVFEYLGRERTQNLTLNFLRLAEKYDCVAAEVLEGIGQRIGVCHRCERAADDFVDDGCRECHEEWLSVQRVRRRLYGTPDMPSAEGRR